MELGRQVQVSFLIPAKRANGDLVGTVEAVDSFLRNRFPNNYEILIIPNGPAEDVADETTKWALELENRFQDVRVCPHRGKPGKGAALRTGYLASHGHWIFFTDADLPYHLEFFERAEALLHNGYDWVTGNRRLAESLFKVPVRLLPLAYGRHRLGLWFNRLIRLLLPIHTRDTQAGIKAFTRKLAQEAFSRQSCFEFLFDIELFLTAHALGFQHAELPVELHLKHEKSTVRLVRDLFQVTKSLTVITFRNFLGQYSRSLRPSDYPVLSRYRGASMKSRLFLWARWEMTPYEKMVTFLPTHGDLLDLGCGHGLFLLALALDSPARLLHGIDHDPKRVLLAQEALEEFKSVQVHSGDLGKSLPQGQTYAGISLIDVLHYFDSEAQVRILKEVKALLRKEGRILIREVDPQGGLIAAWNRFYETLATRIGFTKSSNSALFFRSKRDWTSLLKELGFQVRTEPCSHFLFSDILYVCDLSS